MNPDRDTSKRSSSAHPSAISNPDGHLGSPVCDPLVTDAPRLHPRPSRAVDPANKPTGGVACHGAQLGVARRKENPLCENEKEEVISLQILTVGIPTYYNWDETEDLTLREIRAESGQDEDLGLSALPKDENWKEYGHLNWQVGFNIKSLFQPTSESPSSVRSCNLNIRSSPEMELGEGLPRDSPIIPYIIPEEEEVEEEESDSQVSTEEESEVNEEPLISPTMEELRHQINFLLDTYPTLRDNIPETNVSPSILAWEGASPVIEEDFRIPSDVEIEPGSPAHLHQLWGSLGLGQEISLLQGEVDRVASPGEGDADPGPGLQGYEDSPRRSNSSEGSLPELYHVNNLVYDPQMRAWRINPEAEPLQVPPEPPTKKLKLEEPDQQEDREVAEICNQLLVRPAFRIEPTEEEDKENQPPTKVLEEDPTEPPDGPRGTPGPWSGRPPEV